MNITAQFPFTTEVFKPAYKVNLNRQKFVKYGPYLGAAVLVGAILPLVRGPVTSAIAFFGIFVGLFLLLNQRLIIFLCIRRMKLEKQYGETLTSTFSPEGFTSSAPGSEGKMRWNKVREVVFSSAGILVYPQPLVFFFTPRRAFNSDEDFKAAKAMITDAGVKVKMA